MADRHADRPSWAGAVDEAAAACGSPGCAVAVTRRDGRTAFYATGWADVATRRPVTAETVFHLFSGTKLFTATAVVMMSERGLLGLDDPAALHLPEAAAGLGGITLRHLLTHTSGLADTLRAVSAVHLQGELAPDAEAVLKGFRIAPQAPPGKVAYRNVNYALLGAVIARRSGMTYETFIARHILQPLGSGPGFAIPPAAMAATGYAAAFGPLWLAAPLLVPRHGMSVFGRRVGWLRELRPFGLDAAAIGGLSGAAEHFLPFLRLHLGGPPALLTPGSLAAMHGLQAKGAAGIAARLGVGLGWKIGMAGDGARFLNHEGGGPGFTSELRLYPCGDLGIVVMMNRWLPPRRSHLAAHAICESIRTSA